jgi:hypothetical protein
LTLRPAGKRQAIRVVGILDRLQRKFEDAVGAPKLKTAIAQLVEVEQIGSRIAEAARRSGSSGRQGRT